MNSESMPTSAAGPSTAGAGVAGGTDAANGLPTDDRAADGGSRARLQRHARPGVFARMAQVLEMIKVQHTVFALPFALMAALTAAGGWRALEHEWRRLLLVVVAVLGARSAAMAFNRLADAEQDATNPRTAGRHIPAGLVSRGFALAFTVAALGVFGVAAWLLNPLCLYGAPIVAVVLLGYSYSKRFTWLCHWWLGASLGLAPIGAWAAMRGNFTPLAGGVSARLGVPVELFPIVLGAAVMVWTAGFDLLYACQDFEFDASRPELHSGPKRFGLRAALKLARGMHLLAAALLAAAAWLGGFGAVVWAGLAIAGGLMVYEHRLVRPDDLTRIEAAFFMVNGAISLILFAAVAVQFALK
ncbi:MAG: UbiA-like polyprenyltransferase [Planctomycetota bacterium]